MKFVIIIIIKGAITYSNKCAGNTSQCYVLSAKYIRKYTSTAYTAKQGYVPGTAMQSVSPVHRYKR